MSEHAINIFKGKKVEGYYSSSKILGWTVR